MTSSTTAAPDAMSAPAVTTVSVPGDPATPCSADPGEPPTHTALDTTTPAAPKIDTAGAAAISQSAVPSSATTMLPPSCTRPTVVKDTVAFDTTPGVSTPTAKAAAAREPAVIGGTAISAAWSTSPPPGVRVCTVTLAAACDPDGERTDSITSWSRLPEAM